MKHPTRGVETPGPSDLFGDRIPDNQTGYARIRRGVCGLCGEVAKRCECDGPRELDFGRDDDDAL